MSIAAESEELDFAKICRVCCEEGSMVSVFKVHLSKKLMACSQVQVWPNDGLPAQICSKCISILYISYQFKKQCEKSDVKLRKYKQHIEEQLQLKQLEEEERSKLECESNFVYLDCSSQPEEQLLDVGEFDQMQNVLPREIEQLESHGTNLTFNNAITFDLQGLHVPANVQFPTYTVQQANVITISPIGTISAALPMHATQFERENILVESKAECDKKSAEPEKKCPTCGKEFPTMPKLTRHIKTHAAILPYKCQVCQKGFSHSGNFKVHMRMHNNERPFSCNLCNKACRQQQDLEKHMRTHTGFKPHVCKICLKAFSISSNLIAHTRTHSNEKPYVCLICQKAFCQSNELKKHNRIHNSDKCNQRYYRRKDLPPHSSEHNLSCSFCNKKFSQSSCLQAHIRKHNETESALQGLYSDMERTTTISDISPNTQLPDQLIAT